MMGPYWYGAGWGWMAMGWLMMLLFWILVIVGAAAVVRWGTGLSRRTETPSEILRRRYAAGEITKEQFDSMRRDVA